ncbi:MAG: hypothetical protein RLY11_1038, partial [Bacteroidota bacterium]
IEFASGPNKIKWTSGHDQTNEVGCWSLFNKGISNKGGGRREEREGNTVHS